MFHLGKHMEMESSGTSTAKEMVVASGRYTFDGIVADARSREDRRLTIASNMSLIRQDAQKENVRTVLILDQGLVDNILIVGIQIDIKVMQVKLQ